MSDYIEVIAIVEGKTEQVFVESVLQPYLAQQNIFISATQVSKPGQKGGDVRFSRVSRDIERHLKQRPDTYVTTLVDYYGVKEWPGLDTLPAGFEPARIAEHLNGAARASVVEQFAAQQAERRFIPFIAVHEFEAWLFSDSAILAAELGIPEPQVVRVLEECGEPEAVNMVGKRPPPSDWMAGQVANLPKQAKGLPLPNALVFHR